MEMEEMTKKLFGLGILFITVLMTMRFIIALIRPKSQKCLPPVIKAWPPIIGGLLKFLKAPPIMMLREEYHKLGSVFTLNLFLHKNITFLIGPEESYHFFNAPESEISQKEVYRFSVPIFGPGVLFEVDYPVRKEQFRFCSEALQPSKLKCYVEQMAFESKDFFSKWGDTGTVDLKAEMERLVMLTASRSILGKEVRDKLFGDVSALFHDLVKGMHPLGILFPHAPIRAHHRRDKARKKLDEIFSKIIASRKAYDKSEDDFLQCFIDSIYKNGRSTSEGEVIGLLVASFFSGQQTTTITSIWTGIYLLLHKEYLSDVLSEQKSLMEKHGNIVDYDTLSMMDVLYRCIKEALRLHPPLVLLLRQSHMDFSVTTRDGKQYDVPKGHIIATSPAIANRLPYIYKNPDRYDPNRFAPSRNEDKLAGSLSYLSFGGGRHGCLGEQFALRQIMTIWSILIRNFDLELISPCPQIDWNSMVVGIQGNVMVRYKRKHSLVD